MSEYTGSKAPMRPQDIRWETVKTEEEEYLDKLQSKLTRVMDGFQPTPPKGTNNSADPDEISDMTPVSQVQDHDEGLHLMYDHPRPTLEDTSSTQPFPSSSQPFPSSQLSKTDVSPATDILPSSRQRSIRFRSRVRITSGVHSVSSSCGSHSSSISVPLQGPHGHSVSKSRATLSDIVSFEDANSSSNGPASPLRASSTPTRHHRPRSNSTGSRSSPVDERTPLASASRSRSRRSYTERFEDEEGEDDDAELDRLRAAARKSEEAVMFGKWPQRLLNLHWWWWKIEPIVCCSWLGDESDLE